MSGTFFKKVRYKDRLINNYREVPVLISLGNVRSVFPTRRIPSRFPFLQRWSDTKQILRANLTRPPLYRAFPSRGLRVLQGEVKSSEAVTVK